MAGSVNDSVSDMLTRIRNAVNARHMKVPMPLSKLRLRIAEVLKSEGFIEDFEVQRQNHPQLTIQLRYDDGREPVMTGLKRCSKPGLRQYVRAEQVPTVRNGLGIAIVSTSQGVMTDREARRRHLGGELLATVW